MPLSQEQLNKAKAEAISHLEYSINILCNSLGLDVASIDDVYIHDVVEGEPLFLTHELLKKQVANLALLTIGS